MNDMNNINYLNNMNENSLETCGICLSGMENETKYRKYTCFHYFHKTCISAWNRSCPICRNPRLNLQEDLNIIHENVKVIRMIPKKVPIEYYYIYLESWRNKQCIDNNHSIFFRQPYGVLCGCETCGEIQAFNLSHSPH